MSRRVTNLLFPTPVWRIDLEASEELNATLLGQLKDVDWSAKARRRNFVARQAGGEAQGGEFSRTTPCEASHSPPPSVIDRFSGPSLGRTLGRGGSRPSLLFPFNHPPTIRCSAK